MCLSAGLSPTVATIPQLLEVVDSSSKPEVSLVASQPYLTPERLSTPILVALDNFNPRIPTELGEGLTLALCVIAQLRLRTKPLVFSFPEPE